MSNSNCLRIKPIFKFIRLLLSSNMMIILLVSILISCIFLNDSIAINPLVVFITLFLISSTVMLFSFFMNYRATLYEINKDEISFNEGFINHQVVSVKIKDIKEIHLTQSFIQRVFSLGTIRVLTAGSNSENGGGLKMKDIKNAHYAYIQLNKLHRQNLNNNVEPIKEIDEKDINIKPNIKSPYYTLVSIPAGLFLSIIPAVISAFFIHYFCFIVYVVSLVIITFINQALLRYEYKHRKYKISNTRIECKEGFFNHQYTTIDVRNIREVRLERGLFQRMFNLGSVVISSPANNQQGTEIENDDGITAFFKPNINKNNMSYYKVGIHLNNIDDSSQIYKILNSMQDYSNSNEGRNILNDKPQLTYTPTFILPIQATLYISSIVVLLFSLPLFFINPLCGFLSFVILSVLMCFVPIFLLKKNYDCTKYEIYPTRIEFHEGFILNKSTSILIKNIREIHLDENFFQKKYGLGTIKFLTSGTTDLISANASGVVFRDIKNSKEVYDQMNTYVKNNIIKEDSPSCEDKKTETINETITQEEDTIKTINEPKEIKNIKPDFIFWNIFLTNFIPSSFFIFIAIWSSLDDKVETLFIDILIFILSVVLAFLISIIVAIATALNYKATNYCLDEDKVIFDEGFINHKHTAIEYKNIREISIKQNAIQRFFKVGTINILTSANTMFSGLKIKDVKNSYEVYENLKSRIITDNEGKLILDLKPNFNLFYILLTYGLISFIVISMFFGMLLSVLITSIIVFAGIIKHKKNSYKIFNNKIESNFSFISKSKSVIPREKIREIHIRQGLLQKMFNIGQLLIVTSASGKKGSTLFNISKPLEVKGLLSKMNA